MKWSLSLGKLSGIKVFVHWTFLILIAWVLSSQLMNGQSLEQALWVLLYVLLVFVCVTLHELGHALAARRFNIVTRDITLLPIGGVARLEEIPQKPKEELIVSLAGPLVNVVIALVLWGLMLIIFGQNAEIEAAELLQLQKANLISLLPKLMLVNWMLVVFNLIPAFPMDGGRVLRAILSMRMDRVRATRIAVSIGQVLAIVFAFWGLFHNPFLIFIAVFVYLGAQAELGQAETDSLLGDHKVGEILMRDFSTLSPHDSLGHAAEILLNGQERCFVVLENGSVSGTLGKEDIIKGLQRYGTGTPILQVMKRDVRYVDTETALEEAMNLFTEEKYTLLPVLEEGEFVGILDKENIQEFMMVQAALQK